MSTEAEGTIQVHCGTEEAARRAAAALAPDNEDHLEVTVEGADLVCTLPARAVGTTLNTLDDALACLQALEGIEGVSSKERD